MALDAICLAAVVEELRSAICGGRIDKIYQSECSSRPIPAIPDSTLLRWNGKTRKNRLCFVCCFVNI